MIWTPNHEMVHPSSLTFHPRLTKNSFFNVSLEVQVTFQLQIQAVLLTVGHFQLVAFLKSPFPCPHVCLSVLLSWGTARSASANPAVVTLARRSQYRPLFSFLLLPSLQMWREQTQNFNPMVL